MSDVGLHEPHLEVIQHIDIVRPAAYGIRFFFIIHCLNAITLTLVTNCLSLDTGWNKVMLVLSQSLSAMMADSMSLTVPHQILLCCNADWLVGESGRTVRKPLCHELVRLLDTLVAGNFWNHF